MSIPDDLSLDNCGCCEPEPLPETIYNRPGLPALSYRAGTYRTFVRRMMNRLSAFALPDGDYEGVRPLAALSTRELDDPSVALFDASAVVADVLTFYQERIANEGFLRTSIERQSILELARAIGYELSPGVAANTYLAFALENAAGAPTSAEIPAGTKVQSIPPQDRLPQTFETTEPITAHKEWNAIHPRMTRGQHVWTDTQQITLAGTSTNLKVGDRLLIVVQDPNTKPNLVRVHKVTVDQEKKLTTVAFTAYPSLAVMGQAAPPMGSVDINTKIPFSATSATAYVVNKSWDNDDLNTFLTVNEWDAEKLLAFVAEYRVLHPDVTGSVFAMRQSAPFFGHNAPRLAALPQHSGGDTLDYGLGNWDTGWQIWMNQVTNKYYVVADVNLDHTLQGILPDSWAVIEDTSGNQLVCRVSKVFERSLQGFAMSAKMTGLNLKKPGAGDLGDNTTDKPVGYEVTNSVAHLQSDLLSLTEVPVGEALYQGTSNLPLDGLVLGLSIGQTVMLSGERWDADGVTASETLVIKTIMHYGGYTYLTFEQGFEHYYKRDTVTINANVAAATHGEATSEILGNGMGSQTNQRFTLRRPPLTYVSAPTPSGTQSTLEVRVNDLLWTEAPSLYPLGPNDQQYIVRMGDDGKATVIFGDGKHGGRPPSGSNNIVAKYRSGIGLDGEVQVGTLTMLSSKPLGVKSVTNPLAARGADDPEKLENARDNAPLTVRTLDRIVSLTDYEDFARSFAGVGKAQAVDLWSGETHLVHVTVAGADGDPIDSDSNLFANLIAGINKARDPAQIVRVDSFARLLFNLEANVAVDSPRYIKEDVFGGIQAALLEAFAFEKRAFGQLVTSAEVITVIQQIGGVIAVDLDTLHLSNVPAEFNTLLPAQIARANDNGAIMLAQLLLINPIGVTLAEMKP